jgi:hypothetical protein
MCHCEPFVFCHSERSPEPSMVQGEAKNLIILLRVNSVKPCPEQSEGTLEIATSLRSSQ